MRSLPSLAPAAPLDDLIVAAKKDGTLNFYGPSTLKADGAQALAQAFNKKNTLPTSPSNSSPRDR
jgi:hypothetical protein